ncbi:MAG: DNA-3-methyladenine glycosylase [Thermoanaerobaculia bacterium]
MKKNYLKRKNLLPQEFYKNKTILIAKQLLGAYLVRTLDNKRLVGKIVETEAYLGFKDPACHSYKGKTERCKVMFWEGGHFYVYFIYGFYHCLNVVTEKEGVPEAVLIRALEPVEGVEIMRKLRKGKKNLTSGPGVLCEAFKIDRSFNGHPVWEKPLQIFKPLNRDFKIVQKERIGVDYAGEAKRWKLRFYIKNNPYVSKK